jgi:hypothetical protein
LDGLLSLVAFVGEDGNFLIVAEQVTCGLKINKKGALVGLFILVVAVGPNEFVVFGGNAICVRDIIDLIQIL